MKKNRICWNSHSLILMQLLKTILKMYNYFIIFIMKEPVKLAILIKELKV